MVTVKNVRVISHLCPSSLCQRNHAHTKASLPSIHSPCAQGASKVLDALSSEPHHVTCTNSTGNYRILAGAAATILVAVTVFQNNTVELTVW